MMIQYLLNGNYRSQLAKTVVFCDVPKGVSPSISSGLFAMYHARVDDEDKKIIFNPPMVLVVYYSQLWPLAWDLMYGQ